MTGQHETGPAGNAARDATATPYTGRHRDPRRCAGCGHLETLCECPHDCDYPETTDAA